MSDPNILPNYEEWTIALSRFFFEEGNSGKRIVLTCDKDALRDALQKHRNGLPTGLGTPEKVRDQFFEVVRERLNARSSSSWWIISENFRSPVNDRPCPGSLCLLAAQVLAVYEMSSNRRQRGQKAYWKTLCRLVGVENNTTRKDPDLPRNLSRDHHREMWRRLKFLLNEGHRGRFGILEVPVDKADPHYYAHGTPYVNMPFSQALLSKAELDKIEGYDGFFSDVLGRPPIDREKLSDMLKRYRESSKYFTMRAQDVLSDDFRFPFVVEQIETRFNAWERPSQPEPIRGGGGMSTSRPTITITPTPRSVFHISSLSGRRPKLQIFVVRGEEPAEQIPEKNLSVFMRWDGCFQRQQTQLHFPDIDRNAPLLTVWSEIENNFISHRKLQPGQWGMILFFTRHTQEFLNDIDQIASEKRFFVSEESEESEPLEGATKLRGLPKNWEIVQFKLKLRESLPSIPDSWQDWIDTVSPRIMVYRGLRLNRHCWVDSVPLTVIVLGPSVPDSILLDGRSYPLDTMPTPEHGEVRCFSIPTQAGQKHWLQLPGSHSCEYISTDRFDFGHDSEKKTEAWQKFFWQIEPGTLPRQGHLVPSSADGLGRMFGPRIETAPRIETGVLTDLFQPSVHPCDPRKSALELMLALEGMSSSHLMPSKGHPLVDVLCQQIRQRNYDLKINQLAKE